MTLRGMLDLLPECAEGVGAAERKTNMSVGSKSKIDLRKGGRVTAADDARRRQCGLLGISPDLTKILPTSRLAALNFHGLHDSGWLESALDWCYIPCKCSSVYRPEKGVTRFVTGIWPPAGKDRPPDSKQRHSHELHELFGSSTTRRAAALNSPAERHTKRFFTGNSAAGRQKPPFRLKAAPSPQPHELFSSSRTRRAAARDTFDYIELFPASETPGKSRPPYSKQRPFPESREPFSSWSTRRAAARIALTIQKFIPRAGPLGSFAPGILPPAGKNRSSKLKATSSRATLLVSRRLQISHFKSHPSRIPDIFGNSIFRRPANKVGARNEPKSPRSPRAALFPFSSKLKIKIKNRFFGGRRAPNSYGDVFSPAFKFDVSSSREAQLQHQQVSDFGLLKRAQNQMDSIVSPPNLKPAQTACFNLSAISLQVQKTAELA
ncbi:hypothetical protein R3P38DRAFT_2773863 [Favolaschia claudopus]|uniref:Uncharacterized protein n=1 Tax=Favolaschia claudopus TaxID=2862362 RepID=A0AAW0C5X6_9AGAR